MLLPSGLQENRLAKTCSISPRVGRTSSLFVFRRCQSLKSMATGWTHQLQTCLRLQLWSLSLALLTWLRNTFFSFKARGARLSLVSFSSVEMALVGSFPGKSIAGVHRKENPEFNCLADYRTFKRNPHVVASGPANADVGEKQKSIQFPVHHSTQTSSTRQRVASYLPYTTLPRGYSALVR